MHVYITLTGEAVDVHQQATSMVGSHVLPHHDQSVLNPSVLMSSIPIESSVSDSFVLADSSGSVPNTRVDGQELPANSVSSHEHEAVTPTRPSEQESVSTPGVEEAVSDWSGKFFKHGHTRMEAGLYLQDLENLMYKSYCAKHNQHAKHANSRGVWGHAPPGNF